MTTIAYRDGIMAADSRYTNGWGNFGVVKKIFKTDKGLFGISGSINPDIIENVLSYNRVWLKENNKLVENVGLIHVDTSGRILSTGEDSDWCWNDYSDREFFSIGSGGKYADGAMAAGASAEMAVRLASTLDIYTDDNVQTIRL